jgi:hypothetical protein
VPPRKKLLDISSGARYRAFRIGRVRRLKLEQKIGRSIPAAAWDELIEATREYRADTDLEQNTPPISPAKDRVKKLRAAAEAIWDVHEERVSDKRRTPYRHIRADRLRAWALESRNMMRDFDAELRHVAKVEAEDSGFRVGEGWDWWIWRLTQILKKVGLPTGARNDALGRTSPFVEFVDELQKYLPKEYRQHWQSLEALTKAIGRGRAWFGTHKRGPGD